MQSELTRHASSSALTASHAEPASGGVVAASFAALPSSGSRGGPCDVAHAYNKQRRGRQQRVFMCPAHCNRCAASSRGFSGHEAETSCAIVCLARHRGASCERVFDARCLIVPIKRGMRDTAKRTLLSEPSRRARTRTNYGLRSSIASSESATAALSLTTRWLIIASFPRYPNARCCDTWSVTAEPSSISKL